MVCRLRLSAKGILEILIRFNGYINEMNPMKPYLGESWKLLL